MNLRIGKIINYNNKILVTSSSFDIRTNLKINLDDNKQKEKDKPIKEDKQDIKMIKTKPDTNEITYEKEKAASVCWVFK